MRRIALALLATVGVAGCGGHHHPTGVVPWVNRPLPLYVVPTPRLIPYPTSAPPCRGDELRISQGRGGPAAGTVFEQLVFTNVGRRTCLLRGYPTISGLHPRLETLVLHVLLPSDVPPGGRGLVELATGDVCGRPATVYRDLRVKLPGGTIVRSGAGVKITEICGLEMSRLGRPARYTPLSAAKESARLELPRTVRAGTVLRYSVTLSNPTRTRIELRPCPGYTEGIYAQGLVFRRSFALNCDRVTSIGAGDRVRYAMELRIPARAEAGIAKVGWNLDHPNGPFTGGVIRIVG